MFRENFDRRIVAGMVAILAGALILAWEGANVSFSMRPALVITAACLAWGLDNNFTRKVALFDSTWIALIKGLSAGFINLLLALASGAVWPSAGIVFGALLVGCLGYGVSLALFVVGLRLLGTARTGAYFAVAPFFGAILSIPLLLEPVTLRLVAAGVMMAIGVWLHLTERHSHTHTHLPVEHDHEHVHDSHHQHEHEFPVPPGVKHAHLHSHQEQVHEHEHYPDAHHRHEH